MKDLKLNISDETYAVLMLYKSIYKKQSFVQACKELIAYGLKYKDLQRQKENLKPLTQLAEEVKIIESSKLALEMKRIAAEETNDIINRVVALNKED